MKLLPIICLFCSIISLVACKKDSGIIAPVEREDFSGLYWLQGTMNYLSNPPVETPLNWTVTATDPSGYTIGDDGTFKDTADRWALGGIYSQRPGYGQFRLIVYGGKRLDNSASSANWTVAELDSIFQPGKSLFFGTNFGEVAIEFGPPNIISGDFLTEIVDNAAYQVKIETVNDFKIYFPGRKWVKQVIVSFDARLKILSPYSTTIGIELKNCRASLLFRPNVE